MPPQSQKFHQRDACASLRVVPVNKEHCHDPFQSVWQKPTQCVLLQVERCAAALAALEKRRCSTWPIDTRFPSCQQDLILPALRGFSRSTGHSPHFSNHVPGSKHPFPAVLIFEVFSNLHSPLNATRIKRAPEQNCRVRTLVSLHVGP